tara:strand:+ start:4673 stop:5686 length:1014 start_codon:yes stop_codon:yes gene_type:complete
MLVYFFFPFALIFLSSLGIIFSPNWSLAPFIWVFFIIPIIDNILPNLNQIDKKLKEYNFHNIFLILVMPCIFLLIISGLFKVSQDNISILESVALGAAVGMSGGSIGITSAHELIHRNNKKMRALGVIILILCFYGHFRIEHIYGHHKHFATKNDPATARKNENFYFYFARCVISSIISSWNIEKNILKKKNLSTLNYKNRMLHYLISEIILLIISYMVAGINGIAFIIFHSLISIILLELVNYIQHYGLIRKEINGKFEKYQEHHSWNSRFSPTNWSTFNLGLHSEHHQTATKHYPLLSHNKKQMEMPTSYPGMLIMALIPPIWFRIMNSKLKTIK